MKRSPHLFLALALSLPISLPAPLAAACLRNAIFPGAMSNRLALSNLGLSTHVALAENSGQNALDQNQERFNEQQRQQQEQRKEEERRLEQQQRDNAERNQQRNNCQAQAQAEYENCRANNPNGSCQIASCE